jgi:hypothetical protein
VRTRLFFTVANDNANWRIYLKLALRSRFTFPFEQVPGRGGVHDEGAEYLEVRVAQQGAQGACAGATAQTALAYHQDHFPGPLLSQANQNWPT